VGAHDERPWRRNCEPERLTPDGDSTVFSSKTDLAAALTLPLGIALVLSGTTTATASPSGTSSYLAAPEPAAVSFAEEIMPIFEASCVSCHGEPGEDGEVVTEASLDLTTYEGLMAGSEWGSVIEPGNPDDSLLLDMVAVGDMPEDGDPLDPADIDKIRTWITEGAENN
jgi:mono/diheme cytochrome c family protein